MDRFRVNRQSGEPSRFSDGPLNDFRGSPENYRGGLSADEGNSKYHGSFESLPSHPIAGRVDGVARGFQQMGPGAGFTSNHQVPLTGQKRGFPHPSRVCGSPDYSDGSGFAKLFVGSVPRTSTEEDIRPLFEEHGRVIEVALIRDKRTGQQQGCCFIKFATSEEAERAIRALHNQHILPGGVAPMQVRYADGERERLANMLGTVEYKLFVGSLDRQATERDVEGIFSPYGRVEDVYLMRDEMKASRGCGFVKFSQREMAIAAINALNGIYTMPGCDQPLIVRFADPKKPRAGESRGAATFGNLGFGPHIQTSGNSPISDTGDTMGGNLPPSGLHSGISQNVGPSSVANSRDFGRFPLVSGDRVATSTMGGTTGIVSSGMSLPSASTSHMGGSNSALAVPTDGAVPLYPVSSTPAQQHNFNQPLPQGPSVGQQISPLQKSFQSPQNFPQNLPLPQRLYPQGQPQTTRPTQTSIPSQLQPTHLQFAHSTNQVASSQQLIRSGLPLSGSQPQSSSVTPQTNSLNKDTQPQATSSVGNQQQLPVSGKQQLNQSIQHPPSQLAQLISQQTQSLHASFQSSRQAFTELQQQMQLMQPSNHNLMMPPQGSQAAKLQWTGTAPQSGASTPALATASVASSVPVISQGVPSGKYSWTEHTSPDGFKYYHNSMSGESTWEKPEELMMLERGQQKHSVQQTMQSHPHALPTQQVPQAQNFQQLQPQFLNQHQLPSMPSMVQGAANSGMNEAPRVQQGPPAATQEWMWKNNPTG